MPSTDLRLRAQLAWFSKQLSRLHIRLRFVLVAVVLGLVFLGLVFWLVDALIDGPTAYEISIRLFVFGLLLATVLGLAHYVQRLIRQAERYRGIFLESPDAIFLVDPNDGAFVDFNDRASRMLGYERKVLATLTIAAIEARQSETTVARQLDDIEHQGQRQFETRLRTGDGQIIDAEVYTHPLCHQGQPLHLAVVKDISERKASTQTIEVLHQRIALALETAAIGIWQFDIQTNRLIWDDAMFRLYGLTPDRFEGVYETWERCVHPDDLESATKAARATLWSGEPFNTEFRIVRPDGEIRYIQANARVLKDENGVTLGQIGTNYDVTERRRSELALQESEALFRDLAESVPGAVFRYLRHPDGRDSIQYMSPGCFTIWELSSDELQGDPTPMWRMILEEDIAGMVASVEHSAKTGHLWEHEWRIRTGSGRLKHLLGRAMPRYLDDGEVYWNTLIIEVTEHREAVEILNQFFEQPLNLNMIASVEGRIRQVNQAWATFLGRPVEQLEGSRLLDFVHPDDVPATLSAMSDLARGQARISFENRCRDCQGAYRLIQWSSTMSPVSGLLYAVATDISAERRAQVRLSEAAAVFANTAEGVLITDLEGTIRDVNQAFARITGYERAEVIGRNPNLLQSGRHDRRFYEEMWAALSRGGDWRGEIWNRRRDGSVYPELLTISSVKDSSGKANGYVGVFSDISALKETEQRLEHLAHHDPLTDLPNRLLFHARLNQSLREAARRQAMLAIVFVDLDRFKQINDSVGHQVGDALLKEVAQRLKRTVRETDMVARISGDEFVLILEEIQDPPDAERVIEKLVRLFKEPIQVLSREIVVTACIGVSLYPNDGDEPEMLLRAADAAMYRAKTTGRNATFFYVHELDQQMCENWHLERDLHAAIKHDELRLAFQPQIDLRDGRVMGLEALLRWDHPRLGRVMPGRFIPVAEGSGLIRELGEWALRQACAQGDRWLRDAVPFGRVAVNVSGQQLQRGDFAQLVEQVLEDIRFPPAHLELEVTESFVMRDSTEVIEQLSRLRRQGILIAIDDFGTGYSSLSRLRQLPIDRLKIDQSFIRDILQEPNDLAITKTIIAIGQTLGHAVIAEGVETAEHFAILAEIGCLSAQGYAIAKPMPTEAVADWIAEWQHQPWPRGAGRLGL